MSNTTNFAIEKPVVGGYRNSWGGTVNSAFDKLSELLALALPIGSIQMYSLASPPSATSGSSSAGGVWLACDGSLVSRSTYAALLGVIGTTYGAGDGSSTFALPDMRSRVPIGHSVSTVGSGPSQRTPKAIAAVAGEESHALIPAELAAHSHAIPATTHDHDIDPVTHAHVGLRTDSAAGTEDAELAITDPGHTHTFQIVNGWGSGAPYSVQSGPGHDDRDKTNNSSTTDISIAPHNHSFATDSVNHGITTTKPEVIGITSTHPDTGSNTPHNNLPPYLTVSFIILAKHPTF